MNYTMTISRLTVDKLGVKLYDKVSAVLAELVANSYDADATRVVITAPMDTMLARKTGDQLTDAGYFISVSDDGSGMTPQEVNTFFLTVGAARRQDPRRGETSKRFGRKVMGSKGIGKLAPFGICSRMEIISSGGAPLERSGPDGAVTVGFPTAHVILDSRQILSDTDQPYHPTPGDEDETLRPTKGTTIMLTDFQHRRVPKLEDLARQLAQRFGISGADWSIELRDVPGTMDAGEPGITVGAFNVELMPDSKLTFIRRGDEHVVEDHEGKLVTDVQAGFRVGERWYPVIGWMGYAKEPHKDDLMAGVRVYCRGKIAAQTSAFNVRAGFTGEHDVRSYLCWGGARGVAGSGRRFDSNGSAGHSVVPRRWTGVRAVGAGCCSAAREDNAICHEIYHLANLQGGVEHRKRRESRFPKP